MWLNWLPEAAGMTGYPVVVVPGWSTRGHGQMTEVRGILGHHTGSQADGDYPTLNTIINGRSDLPGPLAQNGLGRSGRIFICAAGHSYHAGVGEGWGIVSPPAYGGARLVGIEAESRGAGVDWTKEQFDCYPRLVAANILTAKKHGHWVGAVSAGGYMGHLDWARPKGRKNDPKPAPDGRLSTIWMRARVALYLVNPKTINRNAATGDELVMDAEAKKAFAELLTAVNECKDVNFNIRRGQVHAGPGTPFKEDGPHGAMSNTRTNAYLSNPDPKNPGVLQRLDSLEKAVKQILTNTTPPDQPNKP